MLYLNNECRALTYEEAQAYEPALLPAALCAVAEPPLIASGERVKTAWGARPHGWVRAAWRDEARDRSWKRHRRLQRGSLRLR